MQSVGVIHSSKRVCSGPAWVPNDRGPALSQNRSFSPVSTWKTHPLGQLHAGPGLLWHWGFRTLQPEGCSCHGPFYLWDYLWPWLHLGPQVQPQNFWHLSQGSCLSCPAPVESLSSCVLRWEGATLWSAASHILLAQQPLEVMKPTIYKVHSQLCLDRLQLKTID